MPKTRILIVEDDTTQASQLEKFLLDNGYEVVAVADSLKDALGYFYAIMPDLVIADIYLHGKPDGIAFAKRINEIESERKPVLFLTQHSDLNTFSEAKSTSPVNYLLKPFNVLELQYAIDLAVENFADESGAFSLNKSGVVGIAKDLFIKRGNTLFKVPFQDISHIEVEGKYSRIISSQGVFMVQWTLVKLEEKLGGHPFIRIHRNFIVNLSLIEKVHLKEQMVTLRSGADIPFSQNQREHLVSQLDILK